MNSFIVPGEPKAKGRPRFSNRGGFVRTYTDAQTTSKEGEVKWYFQQANLPKIEEGSIFLGIKVYREIPKSFGKKKRQAALLGQLRPTSRPDLDNYLKLVCDALNGLAWHDDSQVTTIACDKYYSDSPRLEILYKASNF